MSPDASGSLKPKRKARSLVIGYGSIGSRHARILREMGCPTAVVSKRDIDFQPCYRTLREAIETESPEYAVVANTTAEHFDTLNELDRLGFRGDVLVEKPLFAKPEKFAAKNLRRVFVAYDLRFHPLILRLKDALRNENVLSVQCYVGQYLPEWRPSTDYRKGYSASRSMGGGVLRDLSHELDYLLWLFGPWTAVSSMGGHFSRLEIDADDVFCALMSMARCPAATVQVNYLDRTTHREILVNTDCHTFRADLIAGALQIDKEKPEYFTLDNDLTYRSEHAAVLDSESGGICTFREGMDVMELMDAIERSERGKQRIERKGKG